MATTHTAASGAEPQGSESSERGAGSPGSFQGLSPGLSLRNTPTPRFYHTSGFCGPGVWLSCVVLPPHVGWGRRGSRVASGWQAGWAGGSRRLLLLAWCASDPSPLVRGPLCSWRQRSGTSYLAPHIKAPGLLKVRVAASGRWPSPRCSPDVRGAGKLDPPMGGMSKHRSRFFL